jgi:CRISPR-associated protein Csm4
MPLIPIAQPLTRNQMDRFKRFKKLKWLPFSIFEQLRVGNLSHFEFFDELEWRDDKELLYWKKSIIHQPQISTHVVAHNIIDRLSNSAGGEKGNLFSTEENFIIDGGLYFLINVRNDKISKLLECVFQFYHHIGFGGDASIGKGAFEFSVDDFTLMDIIPGSSSNISLSLYLPKIDELSYYRNKIDLLWYQMEMRKGKIGGKLFITDNVWKKTVNAFIEGSCFPKIPNCEIYGQFPIVKESVTKPENFGETFNVHYYGYGMMIDYQHKRDS